MPRLIAVAGLPGSGKSFYIKQERERYGYHAVSDIEQRGFGNWYPVQSYLDSGFDCIVDSADFTIRQRRKDFATMVDKEFPGDNVNLEWVFFENNPTACLTNVLRDCILNPAREFQNRTKNLFNMARWYEIPEGVTTLPVYNPGSVILPYGEFKVVYGRVD